MGHPASQRADATLPETAFAAAHDLRNVLFVISAHSLRLLQAVADGATGVDDAHAIKEAADRGMALARQMLAASASETPVRPVDVNAVIRGVEPLLRRLTGDRVRFDLRLATAPWPVSATATQIEQVVMNLAVNARDAMPDGGCITIVTENRCVAQQPAAGAAHYLVLSVSDTGIGMDEALQARIFEKHFTTKQDSGGTGLGLGIVRSVATQGGGHVEVSSAVGHGSTVRVVLPRAETFCEPDVPAVPVPAPPPAPAATARRILVIEDESGVRDMLQRWLTHEGFAVRMARGATDALELCRTSSFDLVLTDLNLPDLPGRAIVDRLRDSCPAARILVMSGEADLGRLVDAVPTLSKPFSLVELTQAVDRALAQDVLRPAGSLVAMRPRAAMRSER